MSMTDPLGDMLTRIRNAQNRGKPVVRVPASKLHGRVLEVLVERAEGGMARGTSENYLPVEFAGRGPVGSIVPVRIGRAGKSSLKGA